MNVETRKVQMRLPVELNDEEIVAKHQLRRELGGKLTACKAARQDIIAELKREQRDLSDELKTVEAVLEAGAEERMVDCETDYDYGRGWVTTTRLDTGKVVEERAMLDPERQAGLNLQERAETPAEEAQEPADAAQAAG